MSIYNAQILHVYIFTCTTVFKCESCPIEGKKETQTFAHDVKHFFYLQNVWREKKRDTYRGGKF